ncbi:MAG: hypothetical protein IKN82_08255 [Treponema sp.]|nr:hypothetical protein [Treponema sp.]
MEKGVYDFRFVAFVETVLADEDAGAGAVGVNPGGFDGLFFQYGDLPAQAVLALSALEESLAANAAAVNPSAFRPFVFFLFLESQCFFGFRRQNAGPRRRHNEFSFQSFHCIFSSSLEILMI